MNQEFMITLYTLHPLEDESVMQRLWTFLDTPPVQPLRYDSVERARRPFSPEAYREAAALYREDGVLFVRGKKDGFVAFFSRQHEGLSLWRFYFNAGALAGKKQARWLRWLFDLCAAFPALYGLACSAVEHETKHWIIENLPGGGRVRKSCGASIAEFSHYLPGIYWLTLFGCDLAPVFAARWSQLAGLAHVIHLDGGQVAIQLDAPVFIDDMEQRLLAERAIADVLGATFFFDRARGDELTFTLPPPLAATLSRIP